MVGKTFLVTSILLYRCVRDPKPVCSFLHHFVIKFNLINYMYWYCISYYQPTLVSRKQHWHGQLKTHKYTLYNIHVNCPVV